MSIYLIWRRFNNSGGNYAVAAFEKKEDAKDFCKRVNKKEHIREYFYYVQEVLLY